MPAKKQLRHCEECGKLRPMWGSRARYCSRACHMRHYVREHPDYMRTSALKASQANAKRAAAMRKHQEEVRTTGKTMDELLTEKMNAYWEKIKDPTYYTTLRRVTAQSPLRGER